MSDRSDWTWMPHAGHLIVGQDCRFRLNTEVGGWIVSTVGEYRRGDSENIEIGADRTFETMVFPSEPAPDTCCPFRMADADNRDFDGYNAPEDAYKGHIAMCEKWSKVAAPIPEELLT